MSQYPFSIVTPEGTIYKEEVESIVVPGSEGSFGVLKSHTPLVSTLIKGVVAVKKENKSAYFVIDSGILEVDHLSHCLLLSNNAEEVASIEEAKQKLAEINA